jgi:hypothetical protein
MDPFTLALATFGIQKLRGKSSRRSLRDALLAGGIGQFAGTMGMPHMQAFGQGATNALPGANLTSQLRNTTAANMALGPAQASTQAVNVGNMRGAGPLHNIAPSSKAAMTSDAAYQIPKTPGSPVKSGGIDKLKGWWGKADTGTKIGVGLGGATLLGGLMEDDEPYKFDEAPYKAAYEKQKKLTKGLGERASYGSAPLYSTENLYSYKTGGLASIPVKKYAQGGVSYMPSKITHNEKDHSNYIPASGYIEDNSGVGSKNKDTILAQLADGEFVSRTDAILGAGIIEGASPKDDKEMRKKGADFFYKQQAKFKRVFDLLNAGRKTTN